MAPALGRAAGLPQFHRRHTLLTLASLGAWAVTPDRAWANTEGVPIHLAAAWERQGSFHIGLLSVQPGAGQPLHVHASLEVPTRPHGLCVLPDGSVLATARRPGDWLVRWWPDQRVEPQWLWQVDGERSFNGHIIASADGAQLYTTETDAETGASWVGVRDARTLQKIAEWPTHGIDAHELTWDARTTHNGAHTLIVANGGVPTAPETGRVKRDLPTMDSSIVRLDGRTGKLLGQWRLQDQRLSLRHLAWSPDGATLGIALQAEHDDTASKDAAPVLALFEGTALRAVPTPERIAQTLHGYGGSVAATSFGWAVSCPRGNGIAAFSLQGDWQGLAPLPQVCALAVNADTLWAGGLGTSLHHTLSGAPASHPHGPRLHDARLDNHWALAQTI